MKNEILNRLETAFLRHDQHAYDDAGGREQLLQVLLQDPTVIIENLLDMIEDLTENTLFCD